MDKTRISIAMATFNGSKFLFEQLESFSKQTRQPDELVVCDDGSTDQTLEILYKFQEDAPFKVNIFENSENLGVGRNFEKALSLCTGDILFMSDQDDFWFENKLERIQDIFTRKSRIQVICNDQINAREDLSHEGVSRLARRRARGYRDETFTTGCCTAIRKDWLRFTLPFGVRGFDIWTNRLAYLAGAWQLLDEPLQFYRRHGDNVSPGVGAEVEEITKNDKPKRTHRNNEETITLWEREIQFNSVYAERLEKIAMEAPDYSRTANASAVQLKHKTKALQERLDLIKEPVWRRPVPLIRMVVQGKYRNFNGLKSAVVDLAR